MDYNAALITGGATRLGRDMALALAKRGTDVVIQYRSSADEAQATVDELRKFGCNAEAIQADLLNHEQVIGLSAVAARLLGKPLDILINNASTFEYDNLDMATEDSWDRHIGSNLKGPLFLTQQFATQAPQSISDDKGEVMASACVINMLDQRIRKLTPEFMTYTIAKMGLWAFTQTAAQSLAPNIRVNGIAPGPTVKGIRQSDDHFKAQRSGTILERGSNPQDIVAAMNFILDSPSLTGQALCMDGGQHLCWQTKDIIGNAL